MKHAIELLLLLTCACSDTGLEHVELAFRARGTMPSPITLGDAQLSLTRADLAFGPAYLCASEQGRAELCEVAVAELTRTVAIAALDPSTQSLGMLTATTGVVNSSVFDYGVSWLLTENTPRASSLAPMGHSALLEGSVERAGTSLRFRVAVDVKPRGRGELAVNGQRTQHEIVGGEQVTLAVDPSRWVDRLDVAALFALPVGADGVVTIEQDTPAYESIVQGMVSRAPIRYEWE